VYFRFAEVSAYHAFPSCAFIFKVTVTTWYFIFYAALINRVPKSRKDGSSISYGSYVGLSTAIGFLFLSGGARTFATSDEAGASN